MNQLIQNMMGMGGMTDQVIATDFLISSKATVRNYALAITEAGTPELRLTLKEQLRDAVRSHERITNFMIAKGYYQPHELKGQLLVDLRASDTAVNLAQNLGD
ncbi:spore coat protein [Bacillus massilinigeriensis]|uniref:spore coat protein n=1 Tax=Bacillus massilionigeriensis TaxID=1805475 RepID=UPI00096B473D|nr:spore coat protein [Bacillus massilionigeriensis]